MKFLLFIVLVTFCECKPQVPIEDDPEYDRDTPSLILSRGFDYEEHNIVTDDGYILRTFRIIGNKEPNVTRMAVLLVHGIICSSRDWLIADPYGHIDEDLDVVGNNMGFELAKRDYDVWLLNSRGNTYSQNHTRYPTSSKLNPHPEFWDFSHEGIARYDVPAAVDYVLHATGRETIGWIGHSRGTMMMFAALSIYPRLNDLIRPVIALSPIATLKHADAVNMVFFQQVMTSIAFSLPLNYPVGQLQSIPMEVKLRFCSVDDGSLFALFVKTTLGDFPGVFNLTRFPVICSRLPAGTSAKDLRLFAMNSIQGKFTYYDYGLFGNLVKYGSRVAPEFDMNEITNREIYLLKGDSDALSDAADTNKIRRILGDRIREDIIVKYPGWGHTAMLFGQQVGKYVITDVLRILAKYDTND